MYDIDNPMEIDIFYEVFNIKVHKNDKKILKDLESARTLHNPKANDKGEIVLQGQEDSFEMDPMPDE